MSLRKVFNITDINNDDLIELVRLAKEDGERLQQTTIINLALELFFRDKQDDYSKMFETMKREHII